MQIALLGARLTLSRLQTQVMIDALDVAADAFEGEPKVCEELRKAGETLTGNHARFDAPFFDVELSRAALNEAAYGLHLIGTWGEEPDCPVIDEERRDAVIGMLSTLAAVGVNP